MGATVTSFVNAAKIYVNTELSVSAPYYWEDLPPGASKDFTVGRVWFTATAKLSEKAGDLYFPVSEKQAAGMLSRNGVKTLDFVDMTPQEASLVMRSSYDVMASDIESVSRAYYEAKKILYVSESGYYAGWDRTITVTGGPKGAVHKVHPDFPGNRITIVPPTFENLTMNISS